VIQAKSGTGYLAPNLPHISMCPETEKSLWTFL